ncbi:basic leucine zipper transcriptional factor ATF-like 3 [Menidia menidia]
MTLANCFWRPLLLKTAAKMNSGEVDVKPLDLFSGRSLGARTQSRFGFFFFLLSWSRMSDGVGGVLWKSSEEEGRRLKKREKNRVAAQKSRKRQTQRADLLHQACELLEQTNRQLRREVDSLSEEQQLLVEALRAHEPLCPIMHCSFGPSGLQTDSIQARSV